MKASVYYGKGDIRIEKVPDPKIQDPTDAVVRITHACICGSDLWFYRGEEPDWKPGFRTGHEWMGIVEEVGREVRTVKKGDRVPAPFAFSDGSCEYCGKGLFTSCIHGGFWGEKLDPSPVLDMKVDLDDVPKGYAAMDTRQTIKVMVQP